MNCCTPEFIDLLESKEILYITMYCVKRTIFFQILSAHLLHFCSDFNTKHSKYQIMNIP